MSLVRTLIPLLMRLHLFALEGLDDFDDPLEFPGQNDGDDGTEGDEMGDDATDTTDELGLIETSSSD